MTSDDLDELDDSESIDLLILPRVSSERRSCSEPTRRASLLSNMVGVAATPPASDVSPLAAGFSE